MFYYFIFLIFSLLIIIEPKEINRKERLVFLILHFSLLVIFIGLRDETGTDWIHYSEQFFTDYNEHMEFGYLYLTSVFRMLVGDYNIFVFFHSVIYLAIFFLTIKKKLKIGYIVLLLYTGHLLGMMGSNRQVLTLMLCLLAGEKLYDGKIKTFFALILFSACFHISAFIFVLMYYVKKVSQKLSFNNYIFIFAVLALVNFILLNSNVIGFISSNLIGLFAVGSKTHGQLIVYASDLFRPDMLTSIMMTLKRLITLFVLLFMVRFFIHKDIDIGFTLLGPRFKFYFAAYFFSIVLLLVLQPIFPMIATRGGQYFYIYELFLFSIVASKIKEVNYMIFSVLFILFCFVRLSLQFSHDTDLLLPYKAVWYNTEVERSLY